MTRMRALGHRDVERWLGRSADALPAQRASSKAIVSIVVPVFNEASNIRPLFQRISATLLAVTDAYEVLFVSDGSNDGTDEVVTALHREDGRVKLLRLSRNFGHQNALLAGLDHAVGRAVITMDGDLQHPPELIPELLAAWRAGHEVVHACRRHRGRKGPFGRLCQKLAYGLLTRLAEVEIVPQSADFKLFDRCAVDAFRRLEECNRFNRGLARWIGFRQTSVLYDESARHKGRPKYSFAKSFRLLLNGIFSLSSRPLHYVGMLGLGLSVLSLGYLTLILLGWFLDWPGYRHTAGWASIVAIILLVGGLQLGGMWIIGQYLGRTYEEAKRRPAYVVAERLGMSSSAGGSGRADDPGLDHRARDWPLPLGRAEQTDPGYRAAASPSVVRA